MFHNVLNPKLNYDVLQIALLYLKPYDLYGFFIANGLDTRMEFKYNAFGEVQEASRIKQLLFTFSNMILVGLSVTYDSALNLSSFGSWPKGRLNRLVKLEVVGIVGVDYGDGKRAYTAFNSVILIECFNVRNIIIRNMCLHNQIHNNIIMCKNIRSIRFTSCEWHMSIDFVVHLPNLNAVKFTTSNIIRKEILLLQQCSKLKILETVDNLYYLNEYILTITHLKLNPQNRDYIEQRINLSIFNVFPNLKYLNLSNCKFVIHFDVDKMLYELRYLNIEGCYVEGTKDGLMMMIKKKKLRYLNVRGCVFMDGWNGGWNGGCEFGRCVVVR